MSHPLEDIPASFTSGKKWFVYVSSPREEKKSAADIELLGFPCFVPTERKIKRPRHRKPYVMETALFPRYGFVQFDINLDPWGSINEARGVIGLLKANNVPISIQDERVDALKLAQSMGIFDRTKPPKVGMAVEVTSGPFEGWIGKIERARTADRMDVLLRMLGGERRATVPLGSLRELCDS